MAPGDVYGAMQILHVYKSVAVVFYSCCGREGRSRINVVRRWEREPRDRCAVCSRPEVRAKNHRIKSDQVSRAGPELGPGIRAGGHVWHSLTQR